MALYDLESLMDDVRTLYQTKLNDEITAINTEKSAVSGDVEFMSTLTTDDYFNLYLTNKVINKKLFILVGIEREESPSEIMEENFIRQEAVSIQIFMPLTNQNLEKLWRKLLRYSRAIESVSLKNFDSIQGYGKLKTDRLTPSSFDFNGKEYLTAGVVVKSSISVR